MGSNAMRRFNTEIAEPRPPVAAQLGLASSRRDRGESSEFRR